MATVQLSLNEGELAADRTAVASIDFCALWPTAKPILQQLASVISSTIVKFAINTVISAGDAYCSSGGGNRLASYGIKVPANAPSATVDFLSSLSDQELQSLGAISRKAQASPLLTDVGGGLF